MKLEGEPKNSDHFSHENWGKHDLCEFLSDGGDFHIFVKQIYCANWLRRVFQEKPLPRSISDFERGDLHFSVPIFVAEKQNMLHLPLF